MGGSWYREQGNIKKDFEEIGHGAVNLVHHLAQDRIHH